MAYIVKHMARVMMSSGLAIAASTPAPVHAGVWNVAGQGLVSAGYDDNVRLSAVNKVADASGVADLSGQLLYKSDRFQGNLNPRFLVRRYDEQKSLDRTEKYVSMLFQRSSERDSSRWSLNGVEDSTLTSELGLTGLAEVNKKHRGWSTNLGHTHNLSERLEVALQLNASADHYLDAEQTGLVDYNYGAAVISTGYHWTERSTVSLKASAGELRVPDNSASDKTNLSVTLGYGVQVTPNWRTEFSYGPAEVRTQNQGEKTTGRGSVYTASLTRATERTDFVMTFGRDVVPNGLGLLTRRERLQLNLNKSFSERWSTSWTIAANRNRDILTQALAAQDTVIYADVTGSVNWRLTPTWSLSLSAGYARQEVDTNPLIAERRQAALNVSWNGLARRVH